MTNNKAMKTVKNKTVLITGAAMGMGKMYAERSVEEGAKVILWDINEKGLKKTAKELKAKGGKVHTFIVDVSDYKDIARAAKQVLEEIGPVDILFNNAGTLPDHPFL